MKSNKVTQLDLNDVPQVYHNLKYNDGEIFFADNITSIPGLMKQFQVNFIAYVMVLEGTLSLELNATPYHLEKNHSLVVDRKVIIDNVGHSDDFRCLICALSTDVGFSFINKSLMQSVMHILSHPVIEMGQEDMDLIDPKAAGEQSRDTLTLLMMDQQPDVNIDRTVTPAPEKPSGDADVKKEEKDHDGGQHI